MGCAHPRVPGEGHRAGAKRAGGGRRDHSRNAVNRKRLRDICSRVVIAISSLAGGDDGGAGADYCHHVSIDGGDCGIGTRVGHGQLGTGRACEGKRGIAHGLGRQQAKGDGVGGFGDVECAGGCALVVGAVDGGHHRVTSRVARRRRGSIVGDGHRLARRSYRGGDGLGRSSVKLAQVAKGDCGGGFAHHQRLRHARGREPIAVASLARGNGGAPGADYRHRVPTHRCDSEVRTDVAHRQTGTRRTRENKRGVAINFVARQRAEGDAAALLVDRQRAGCRSGVAGGVDGGDYRITPHHTRGRRDAIVGDAHGQVWRKGRDVGSLDRSIVGIVGARVVQADGGRAFGHGERLRHARGRFVVVVPRLAGGEDSRAGGDNGHRAPVHRGDCGVGTGVAHWQAGTGRGAQDKRRIPNRLGRQRAEADGVGEFRVCRVGVAVVLRDAVDDRIEPHINGASVAGQVAERLASAGHHPAEKVLPASRSTHPQGVLRHAGAGVPSEGDGAGGQSAPVLETLDIRKRARCHGESLRDICGRVVIVIPGLTGGEGGGAGAHKGHHAPAHCRDLGIRTLVGHG